MGARYQGLTTAFVERLDAALNGIAGDTYVAVDPIVFANAFACLDALRDGRPFSELPIGHAVDLLQPAEPEPDDESPIDPTSPGAGFIRAMEDLCKKMAAKPDELPDFDAIRRDTVREIEAEAREASRRERARLKRQRKAQRKREAALAATAPTAPDV